MNTPPEGFTYQYAIRMPDGNLYAHPFNGKPLLWDSHEAATAALESMRLSASGMGVPHWAGHIVWQLCSPFMGATDPATGIAEEIQAWLHKQPGGAS